MFNFLSSNIVNSISNVFMAKKERHIILDPFSCLAKLSLLKYMPHGTKISIYDNKIFFSESSNMQGLVRFIYGDGREDLHNLYQPVRKCAKWYWCESNTEMKYLFDNAVAGIKQLKTAYTPWSTIQHTLDYYILILIQNDTRLFANLISDDKTHDTDLTDSEVDSETHGNFNPISSIMKPTTSTPTTAGAAMIKTSAKSTAIGDQQNGVDRKHMTDIHKYLHDLWSEREIGIIINLFHELDAKSDAAEQKNIQNNIMQYCMMKENKLNKFIDDNSHFLT